MLRKGFLVFFVFLLFLCLQGIVLNRAQTQQVAQTESEARPFTDLTLEISAPKRSLLPLQPVPVVIKQSNKTSKSVLGYDMVGFDYCPISLYVRRVGDAEKVRISMLTTLRKLTRYTNVEVAPGASYEAKEWITLGLNWYLPEPGNYELQAVLRNDDQTQSIESNVINIEIKQPTGEDRAAYNLIKNSSAPESLFSDEDFDKKKNTLETIKNKFPNSPYAPDSLYVLGKVHFFRNQHSQAATNLSKLENDDGFIFAGNVKNYLAEIRRQEKNQSPKEKDQ